MGLNDLYSDQASNWLERLLAGSISNWEDLNTRFFAHQIFYDHVNPATRQTIDQAVGGKLRDKNAKESWAFLEDLALYDNESWNDTKTLLNWSRQSVCLKMSRAINDRMTGALPSDTVKNSKLNVNSTSLVLSARSYPMEYHQCSSHSLHSIYDITYSKQTSNLQKDQLQTVIKIGTSKPKEPEKALKDEFKDLHLNLPVLEVLDHAPMYNAILDKYVESL
ncbi:hypothetical protein Tco_0065840 [Tanacetum coccineum]